MFFIQFEATPRRDHPASGTVGGAFINCWIEQSGEYQALEIAKEWIAAARWLIDEPEELSVVEEWWYREPGKAGRQYYEQALIDKQVFVIHTYPLRDESESGVGF